MHEQRHHRRPFGKVQPSDVASPGRPRLSRYQFAPTISGDDVFNDRTRLGHHQRTILDNRSLAERVNAIVGCDGFMVAYVAPSPGKVTSRVSLRRRAGARGTNRYSV